VTIPPAVDEVDADFATREGAQFVAETIYFSDDGDTTAIGGTLGTPGATLNINGDNDVTVKSLDASDADITSLTVNQTGAHTLTVTGGSPAFDGDDVDDTTTSLTLTGTASNVVTLASTVTTDDDAAFDPAEDFITYNVGSGETLPYAGVSGGALETIDTSGHLGTVSLGVISQVNSETFTLNADGSGQTFGCLGEALDDGGPETPTLSATGTWTFTGTPGGGTGDDDFGGDNNLDIEIKAVNVAAGGTMDFNATDICISGDINLSGVILEIDADSTIKVAAGAKLTLTVEQVTALDNAGVNIGGEGIICVTGVSDDNDPLIDTDFSNLRTATVDLSAVTLAATDGDDAVNIRVQGARDENGNDLVDDMGDRIAQTIIGTAFNDNAQVMSGANDSLDDNIDVILRLGADTGAIGDPVNNLTDGSPEEDALQETGDIIRWNGGQHEVGVQVEVDAGFDEVTSSEGLDSNDIVQVAAGAEFYSTVSNDDDESFVATSDTTNDGTAVLVLDDNTGGATVATLDMSAAGGANGWWLVGDDDNDGVGGGFADDVIIGSDNNDTIIDGAADTVDAFADENENETDTFTGGAGDDEFIFNIATSEPAEFAINTVVEAYDREEITVNTTFLAGETVRFTFDIGSQTFNVTLQDGVGGVDLMSTTGVADALADALDGLNGASASATGNVLDVVNNTDGNAVSPDDNDGGAQFELTAVVRDPNGAATPVVLGVATFDIDDRADADFSTDPDATDDDRIEMTITLSGTVVVGETYSMSITPDVGAPSTVTVVATSTDLQDLADAFATNIDAAFGSGNVAASSNGSGPGAFGSGDVVPAGPGNALQTAVANGAIPANTILLWNIPAGGDVVAFEVTAAGATPIVAALSSSSLLTLADTLATADVDVITDFTSGEDTIDFDGLAAGPGNYSEGAGFADFNDAMVGVGGANAAMAGGDTYFFAETAADGGILFYDANGDGVADGAVSMPTVGIAGFDDSDIV